MKFKSRTTALSNHSVVFGISIGVLAALIVSMLLMTGVTSLLISGRTSERVVGVSMFMIRLISALVGVIVGTSIIKEKYIVTAGAVSLAFLLILTGLGIVLYDESFKGFGLCSISVILGGVAGCLFSLKLQNKPQRRKNIRI